MNYDNRPWQEEEARMERTWGRVWKLVIAVLAEDAGK